MSRNRRQKFPEAQWNQNQDTADILEVESLLKKMTPPDNFLIVHAPSVKPGSCHKYETKRIEEIREDLRDRGEVIVRLMKRYKTANARWANTLIKHAFSKHDKELSTIGQKLANCSCTCSCSNTVDPI